MTTLTVEGFQSSEVIQALADVFAKYSEAQKQAAMKKTKGVFSLVVTDQQGKEAQWVIDLKKNCAVMKGDPKQAGLGKADVTIKLSDDVLCKIADGSLNAQKAFMTKKLTVNGNVMLATKLDAVLKAARPSAKL